MTELNKHKKHFYKNKKTYIVTSTVIAVYVLSLYVPLVKPYTQWPLYFIKCGHAPVVAVAFAGGRSYRVWGDWKYGIDPFTEYFCSEEEAKAQDFRYEVL